MTIYAQYAINARWPKSADGNGVVVQATSAHASAITAKDKVSVPVEQATPVETRVRSQNRRSNAQGQAAPGGLKIFSGNGNMSLY
jgi:hypothetical protein